MRAAELKIATQMAVNQEIQENKENSTAIKNRQPQSKTTAPNKSTDLETMIIF